MAFFYLSSIYATNNRFHLHQARKIYLALSSTNIFAGVEMFIDDNCEYSYAVAVAQSLNCGDTGYAGGINMLARAGRRCKTREIYLKKHYN